MRNDDSVLIPIRSIGGMLDNEDPGYVFGAPDIYIALALAYDCLASPAMRRDADGVIDADYTAMRPRLATSWEEHADNSWTVRLRRGVRSHAGNELTAEDIAWGFDKAYAFDTLGAWRWRDVVGLTRLEIVDRHTLRYHLRAPYPTFPNWLLSVTPNVADVTEIRRHVSDADPWGLAYTGRNVAGFGPYALTEMDARHLRFEARDDYWNAKSGAPAIEAGLVGDRATALAWLDEARPVLLTGTLPDETVALLRRTDLTVARAWAGHTSVEIDFTQAPFTDQRVRRALAHATPRERLMRDGLLGQARAWHNPVKRTSQWHCADGEHGGHAHHPYDLTRARALLEEAGLGAGFAATLHHDRRPDCQRMAEILVEAWKEVGIELSLADIATVPQGKLPPLQLRTECAHNLSEPIYDIAHDYAPITPIVAAPGPIGVANWFPRTIRNPQALADYLAVLAEPDRGRKRMLFDQLREGLADFCSSIFIAENLQTIVANQAVPPALLGEDSRLFFTLMTQNCSSRYLPAWQPGG